MQRLNGGKILLPFAVAAILSACGGGGGGGDVTPPGPGPRPGPGPDPGTQGTLNLTINGATGNGDVVAQDADGGAQTALVEGNNSLEAGAYTLVVNGVREPGAIVDDLRTGTANQAAVSVTAGGTQNRTVTYVAGGGGQLWLPAAAQLHGYDATQVTDGGTSITASTVLTTAGINPIAAAFDSAGNMWVADEGGGTGGTPAVLVYTPDQLVAPGGASAPAATIAADASGSLNRPASLASDASGNLWVGNFGNSGTGANTLVQYAAADLAAALEAGGSTGPTPAVTISGTSLSQPYGLAFDADGDLWVANSANDTIVQFAAADLVATGAPTPATTVPAGTADTPRGPAFDASGALWVASQGTDELVRYTIGPNDSVAATLTTSVTPADPSGIAFDNAGNLWVTDGVGDALLKFTTADFTDGGTAAPATTITGAGNFGGVIPAFNPPPADLPLSQDSE